MRKDMARQQLVSIERMAGSGQGPCAEGELVALVRSLVPASLH